MTVRDLLSQRAAIHERGSAGMRGLGSNFMTCCDCCLVPICFYLVPGSWTALHVAAAQGHLSAFARMVRLRSIPCLVLHTDVVEALLAGNAGCPVKEQLQTADELRDRVVETLI